MAAEFTDNLTAFLEDKIKEFNPDVAVGEGTAIRDLFIKPFTTIFQPIVDEILSIRKNLSLANAADLSDDALDALAANFFVTRKPGSKSTGVCRIFFSQPVDEFVAQGTVFVAASGVRFLATADNTITSSGLQLNTFGDLFFFDVNVQAESVGLSGNIVANLISDVLTASDKIVDVTNPEPFVGGSDRETNEDLIARLAIAITFRNLINKPGAKLILLDNFTRLLDVLVVGFGDKHTVEDEVIGVGDGVLTTFQLSEAEDVIPTSLGAFISVDDETVLTGPVPSGIKTLQFSPYTKSTLLLRKGVSFQAGMPLVLGTHYTTTPQTVSDETVGTGDGVATVYQLDLFPANPTGFELHVATIGGTILVNPTHYAVNLATGVITLTPAGVTLLGLSQLHAKYTTNAGPATFGLTKAGATFLGGLQLHARYAAGPLGSAQASATFAGLVTITPAPSIGAIVTADFTYYLMRRDRMSGNSIVLGDDTFGTVTNVHIGGKVDFYLRFLGLQLNELRINDLKAENFLFAQGPADPAPTGAQQYVSTTQLPVISIKNIEKVDPGTNLPSGTFLGTPVDYTLSILPNKLNVNLSMRQKVKLNVLNPAFIGTDIFFRYFTHQDFSAVQAFIDDETNRIVTADLLARAPMPVFVDVSINYSRVTGGPDPTTVQTVISNFINGQKLGACLSAFDIARTLSDAGVKFMQLPITMSGSRINMDFSVTAISAENKIIVPPNYQFVAQTITVNEVQLDSCDAI